MGGVWRQSVFKLSYGATLHAQQRFVVEAPWFMTDMIVSHCLPFSLCLTVFSLSHTMLPNHLLINQNLGRRQSPLSDSLYESV